MSRRQFSTARLSELSAAIDAPLSQILGGTELCVYATGSYGRLEAWSESDADLFLLYQSDGADSRIPRVKELRILGRLIEQVYSLGFPEFDADGRFLEIHDLDEMRRALGSEQDDGVNAFTARMLLLLESRPVFGVDTYRTLLRKIVGFYFQEYEAHGQEFKPLFLLNDILRFWRTLTLNYEHDRHRRLFAPASSDPDSAAKSALKNYKLKFSRLMICFSMVAWLVSHPSITSDQVIDACLLTPADRLIEVSASRGQVGLSEQLLSQYEEFLEVTQVSKGDLLDRFADQPDRDELTQEATVFGDRFHRLLLNVAREPMERYLII